ncbi:MAG: D-alanyl-D-alanine carboxypeptidase/D-alanyl-D-alanine-endopeptidase [Planctomycetes bacterium]|nr:D-alanyl-D-alanine carboxypeptidase/D-alanyl-D-alanine-endopeptidase [Planctomycetota bacterium]
MSSTRRRSDRGRITRLSLLAAANVLAVFWLVHLFGGEANSATEPAPSRTAAVAPALSTQVAIARDVLAPAERASLEARVRAIVDEAQRKAASRTHGKVGASNTTVAVHMRPLGGSDADAFGLDADRALRPASNMKLVTTAAALALLGPDWNFETRAEAAGPIANGVLAGDLVLRAAGDPLYDRDGHGEVAALLAPFCEELKRAGVGEIRGDLVLDEGSFAEPAPGPAWPSSNEFWQEHCALAAGFTVNRGCLTVAVRPGSVGGAANVRIEPAGFGLAEAVDVDTVSGGKLEVNFQVRDGKLSVRGHVPARTAEWSDSCTHPDPVALFGAVLTHELARHGIALTGHVRRERGARGGPTVARIVSPLARYLPAINTDSNNACADQLFFATALAVRGSATRLAGAQTTALALSRLGVSTDGLAQVDGSGLSRDDAISARQLTELLRAVLERDARSAELFRSSLAVAGESGTLDGRLSNSAARGRVRAKTGFIGGTSALSGVAEGLDGRTWVFSILVDYPRFEGLNTAVWKPMQNEICELLVGAGS